MNFVKGTIYFIGQWLVESYQQYSWSQEIQASLTNIVGFNEELKDKIILYYQVQYYALK